MLSIMDFTVEETNLVAIYDSGTLAATLARIADALPEMDDEEIIAIAESAQRKLSALDEEIYGKTAFALTGETDEGGGHD